MEDDVSTDGVPDPPLPQHPDGLTNEDKRFIRKMRQLSPYHRKVAEDFLEVMARLTPVDGEVVSAAILLLGKRLKQQQKEIKALDKELRATKKLVPVAPEPQP